MNSLTRAMILSRWWLFVGLSAYVLTNFYAVIFGTISMVLWWDVKGLIVIPLVLCWVVNYEAATHKPQPHLAGEKGATVPFIVTFLLGEVFTIIFQITMSQTNETWWPVGEENTVWFIIGILVAFVGPWVASVLDQQG